MSGDGGGEKTEQPTEKRRRDSRKDGQVAHSKDFTQLMMFVAIFGYLLVDGQRLANLFVELILLPTQWVQTPFEDAIRALFWQGFLLFAQIAGPVLIIGFFMGVFAEFVQVGPLFATKPITPSLKKLNAVENIKNLFSVKSLVELLKIRYQNKHYRWIDVVCHETQFRNII